MTRQVTLTCHEMGQENCSQVPCWIIDGRRGEWIQRWYIYMVPALRLVWHVTTMVVVIASRVFLFSRRWRGFCPRPPSQPFTNLFFGPAKETVAAYAPSGSVYHHPPSSNEGKLESLTVPRRAHSAIVSKSKESLRLVMKGLAIAFAHAFGD